ncbi:hypothetical protein HZH68_007503 [Vespula germanica]|uniref:Uncharacterized protein n=1 Tax=Vespula germanica TaxID=30212 RepID=A0A834K7S7_VESGE|nr:hypothetical protein HZH68_007503 [Vespula germanica]
MRLRESCIKDYIERTVRDEVEIFTQDRILREDVNVGIDYESRMLMRKKNVYLQESVEAAKEEKDIEKEKPPNRLTNSNTFHPITARLDIRILIFFVREWKDKRVMKERTVCLRGEIEESSRMGFARTFIQHMQYAACRLNLRSAEPTKIRSEGGKEKGSSASSLSYRSCSRDKGNSGTVRKKLRLTPLYDLLVGMLVVGGVGGGGR